MKPRILFVDDEQHVLDGLRRLLSQQYSVTTALGGKEGLNTLSTQEPFAIVVADMRMPGMSGIEFLAEAQKLDSCAVRMMLTGNADRQTAVDAVSVGKVFNFLTKPCDEDTLTHALNAGLELFELQNKLTQIGRESA